MPQDETHVVSFKYLLALVLKHERHELSLFAKQFWQFEEHDIQLGCTVLSIILGHEMHSLL
jgi:hypothetical protein